MDSTKFEKLCKEFPFIPETVLKNDAGGNRYKIEHLDYIQVKLATTVLLGKVPIEYVWPNRNESLYHVHDWQQIHFVFNDGTIIRDAVQHRYSFRDHTNTGQTILEAINLLSLNLRFNLQYIVLTEGGYNIVGNKSMPNFRATINKLKTGTTFYQLSEEAENAAKEWEKSFFHDPYGFSQ